MDENHIRAGKRKLSIALIAVGFILGLLLAFQAGFILFTQKLPQTRKTPGIVADGIVVLTGGMDRISDAMDLLAKGRAKRLLISGVNPNTSFARLMNKYPGNSALFKCCVELDYKAQNTIGNAVETFHWAQKHKLKSLIIVTSAYHMPRSLLELHHVLPRIALLPYPVLSGKRPPKPWRANPFTERLLFFEYLKYILAHMRLVFSAAPIRQAP